MSTPPDPVRNDPAEPNTRTQPSLNPAGGVTPPSKPSAWQRPAMIGAAVIVVLLVLIMLF